MSRGKGVGGHHSPHHGHSDDWLTPPELVAALGPFDLDPCASPTQPWRTAAAQWTEGGLERNWFGRVFLNPPYGSSTGRWLERLAAHGNGIALVFARTETAAFFAHVWPCASALLFLRRRLHFHHPNGRRAKFNSGAPSVLVAYGEANAAVLCRVAEMGAFVYLADRQRAALLEEAE